jgi:hypothetical protein
MVVGDQAPPGRLGWPQFVVDLARRCGSGEHRFLPVQWSESAWPLHGELSGINFIRAYAQEGGERDDWLERCLMIELCRFLLGEDRGDKVPVRVFVSHAKQDINTTPDLFTAVTTPLNTQPVSRDRWRENRTRQRFRLREVTASGIGRSPRDVNYSTRLVSPGGSYREAFSRR